MKTIRTTVIAALLLTAPAFAQADKTAKDTKTTGMKAETSMKSELPFDEKGLLERLHEDNQTEIMLGNLVKQKATTESVKNFGDMMVKDHTMADQQVMQLAQKKNWKLSKPKAANEMERKHMAHNEAGVADLKSLEGVMFDSVYASMMVADHDHAVWMLTNAQKKFSTGETADLARQLLPKLQQHRDAAYKMLGEVKVTEGTTATGGSGTEMEHDMGSMKNKTK